MTFVAPNEMDYLRAVEDLTKKRMTPLEPATLQQARVGKINNAAGEVAKLIQSTDVAEIQDQVNALTAQYSAEQLAAALLSSAADLEKQNTPVEITRERPLPRRKGGGSRNGGGRRDGNRGGGYRGNRNRRGNGDRSNDRRGTSERRFGDYKRRDGRSNESRRNSGGNRREFTVREKG